jgi:hypothetical protein
MKIHIQRSPNCVPRNFGVPHIENKGSIKKKTQFKYK